MGGVQENGQKGLFFHGSIVRRLVVIMCECKSRREMAGGGVRIGGVRENGQKGL
jgi:hypothetical protein